MCLGLGLGCSETRTCFHVLAFRPEFGEERFTEPFEPGAYTTNAHGNLVIVFELPPVEIPAPPSEPPVDFEATDAGEDDAAVVQSAADDPNVEGDAPAKPAAARWMSQMIYVELFWRPKPGTTYVEQSQTNASIQYCIVSGDDVISYEGAGFVTVDEKRWSDEMVGRIESSTLVPARFANEPIDLFGPCQLTGEFTATPDARRVADIKQRRRRLLGRPVEAFSAGAISRTR